VDKKTGSGARVTAGPGGTIDDAALAAQIARRLLAEGAVSAKARGATIEFDGTTRVARPDILAWHSLRVIRDG
jgi:hypothetical protein